MLNITAKKTVDSVLAAFHKTIDELKKVQTQNLAEAERNRQTAQQLLLESQAAEAEAERARLAWGKLEQIIIQ